MPLKLTYDGDELGIRSVDSEPNGVLICAVRPGTERIGFFISPSVDEPVAKFSPESEPSEFERDMDKELADATELDRDDVFEAIDDIQCARALWATMAMIVHRTVHFGIDQRTLPVLKDICDAMTDADKLWRERFAT